MKKDTDIYDKTFHDDSVTEDLDLDRFLSPRCDFRVSAGFKQRVMEEAQVMPSRRGRRWIPLTASSAAAIALLAIMTALLFHYGKVPTERQMMIASVEISAATPSDTVAPTTSAGLMAESMPPKQEKTTIRKESPKRQTNSHTSTTPKSSQETYREETKKSTVIEGDMPMVSREKSLNPDEVRTRLIETHRNAEIAYIERMRNEIENNQAYIAQLMTEEIVYK